MHIENSRTKRSEWCFHYTGKLLLGPARRKLKEWDDKIDKVRTSLSALIADRSMELKDNRIADAKSQAEKYEVEAEYCRVWVAEFARTPDREFILQAGDVVYFGLEVVPPPESWLSMRIGDVAADPDQVYRVIYVDKGLVVQPFVGRCAAHEGDVLLFEDEHATVLRVVKSMVTSVEKRVS